MNEHAANDMEAYPLWTLAEFAPVLPAGRIDRIYTHWSAHDYRSVFPAYHFCIAQRDDGSIVVANTHDVSENMRDVTQHPARPYAAHTRGRNSYALGISMMAMQDARPDDFGPFPLTDALIGGLCKVASVLAAFYNVPVDPQHVLSHAEAAVYDGYFGSGDKERWDIARLQPSSRLLVKADAMAVGDVLRARMSAS